MNTNWQQYFEKDKELVVATSSRNSEPHANLVVSRGFVDGKILIADCQMNRTMKNLKNNNRICLVGGYYRIKGTVEIFNSGKYFDFCQNDPEFPAKHAILITIEHTFDNRTSVVIPDYDRGGKNLS